MNEIYGNKTTTLVGKIFDIFGKDIIHNVSFIETQASGIFCIIDLDPVHDIELIDLTLLSALLKSTNITVGDYSDSTIYGTNVIVTVLDIDRNVVYDIN
jgi:hypothetical protein